MLITIISNCGLLHIVIRSSHRPSNQSTIIMILTLSIQQVISWLPVTLYALFVNTKMFYFYRLSLYMVRVDTTFSPISYCYFIKSFRLFVREVVLPSCEVSRNTGSVTIKGEEGSCVAEL